MQSTKNDIKRISESQLFFSFIISNLFVYFLLIVYFNIMGAINNLQIFQLFILNTKIQKINGDCFLTG